MPQASLWNLGRTSICIFFLGASVLPAQRAAGPGASAPSSQEMLPASTATGSVAGPSKLVEGTVAARLAFQIQDGLIVVPIRINGSKELRMHLDTGMNAPVVLLHHKESLEELALKGGQEVLVGGAGKETMKKATVVPGATVRIGQLEMPGQNLVVVDKHRADSDWAVDGVIGKSIFDRYLAEIDYEACTLTLYEPAGAEISEAHKPLALDLSRGLPVIEGKVDISGGRKIPLRLKVDIGHRGALAITEDAAEGLLPPPRTIPGIAGKGLQGKIPASIGRIASLEFGPYNFREVPTPFLDAKRAGVDAKDGGGNVGSQVWSRFRILLDFPGKRIFLVPNTSFSQPFPYNMAGLTLYLNRDATYNVGNVASNTPASEMDIREGDRIAVINGKNVRDYTYIQIQELFSATDKQLTLTLERGGKRMEKILKLRRLI